MIDRCEHGHTKQQHPACFPNNGILSGVIFPDMHGPIHDKRAYELVMGFSDVFKPDLIVNLGDLGHFNGVSHWNKKRYRIRVDYPIKRDLDFCREHHRHLRESNPQAKIYTLGGNHDQEWPEQWIDDHPEMEGYFDYKRDMGIYDYNVIYVPEEKQPLSIGKLRFIHGWFTTLHHAKKHAEHIHQNVVYGHAHDVQMFTPKNVDPTHRFVSCCLGHLSDEKKADYLRNRPTNWMLAFGIFYVDNKTGSFSLFPVLLPHYQFIWNGELYKN